MAIQHAVLSLLTDGPSHGYELRAAFERAVGPQWGGLNIGHLYQVLERLTRDELVTSAVVPQHDRPDRRVYQLTQKGRAELDQWLDDVVERTAGQRDDLMLKLMAAARAGEDRVRGLIGRQRLHELGRLKGLDQLARQHRSEPLVGLLIEAAILRTRADLSLLDRAEADAAQLVASVQPVAGAAEGAAADTAANPATALGGDLAGAG